MQPACDLTFCDRTDADLAAGRVRLDGHLCAAYLAEAAGSSAHADIARIDGFSMLHPDTLALLRACALEARHGVLEIRAYIGGSTAAIALGLKGRGRVPFLTIEPGGAYPDQPWLPTHDILADWHKILAAMDLDWLGALYKG
jgi:hypothetical protein